MANNVDQFNREVAKFTKDFMPRQMVLFHKSIVLDALARLVQKTPVDTGRARGNWQVTINELPTGELKVTGTPPEEGSPASSRELVPAELIDLQPESVVYVTNNVHYISYLNDGTSRQAPKHFIEETIDELLTKVRAEFGP